MDGAIERDVDHAGFVVLLNPDLDADFIVEFRELKEYLR